jgi:hypothetical protein
MAGKIKPLAHPAWAQSITCVIVVGAQYPMAAPAIDDLPAVPLRSIASAAHQSRKKKAARSAKSKSASGKERGQPKSRRRKV